jgi:uncharacterized OsmC-like protein
MIVDSPPPLGGPNEELNPLDILLAALATCGTFVIETAAKEMNIGIISVNIDAEGDFDPRGVKGGTNGRTNDRLDRSIQSTLPCVYNPLSLCSGNF